MRVKIATDWLLKWLLRFVPRMDTPTFRQHQIQVFNDNGTDETDSTSKAAVGVDITGQALDENLVVRFLVQETAGNAQANYKPQIQIRLNGGTYQVIDAASTIGRASASAILVDTEDSTQRIGSGTFVSPNAGVDTGDGVAGQNALNFVGNDETEFVYCLQIRSAEVNAGDNVEFRIDPAFIDVYGDPEIKVTIAAGGGPTTALGTSTITGDLVAFGVSLAKGTITVLGEGLSEATHLAKGTTTLTATLAAIGTDISGGASIPIFSYHYQHHLQ